ncbi:hypothetical protein, partial [Streptomyces albus]|uniref:hypothetical protein n=1 Tax=Streptomyces albus TaxID=1888 RepID=UPI001969FB9B
MVGEYLENLLLRKPSRIVGQDEALGLRSPGGKAAVGAAKTAPPAVELETRQLVGDQPTEVTPAQRALDLYDEALRQRKQPPQARPATQGPGGRTTSRGIDPIEGWKKLSRVSGRPRTSTLRAIDRAVQNLRNNPGNRDLARDVLDAVSQWKAEARSDSTRWPAVEQLEARVVELLGQLRQSAAAQEPAVGSATDEQEPDVLPAPPSRSQVGHTGYAPPTREQVTSGAVAFQADANQGGDLSEAYAPQADGLSQVATTQDSTRPQSPSQTQPAAGPSASADASAGLTPALAELAGRLPGMEQGERAEELALLPAGDLEALASRRPLVRDLRATLSAEDFADTAARLLLRISPGVQEPMSVRREAVRRIAPMLGDPDVAVRLLDAGHRIHVVPRDVELSAVGPFRAPRGNRVADGRLHTSLRGLYTRTGTGAGEETLLGELAGVPGVAVYADGYSTVTHEFAHAVHMGGLSAEDRRLVKEVFDAQKSKGWAGKFPDGHWYDPVGENPGANYSSRNEYEFFAQLSNAWLGVNAGTDPYTEAPRNNGASWVRENLPEIVPLLERIYGPGAEPGQTGANPLDAVQAENQTWTGFRAFWDRADRELYLHHHPLMRFAPATSQGHAAPGVVFAASTPGGPVPQTVEPVSTEEALPAPPSLLVTEPQQVGTGPDMAAVIGLLLRQQTVAQGPGSAPQVRVLTGEPIHQVLFDRMPLLERQRDRSWREVGSLPVPFPDTSYVLVVDVIPAGFLIGGDRLRGHRLGQPLENHPALRGLTRHWMTGKRIMTPQQMAALVRADLMFQTLPRGAKLVVPTPHIGTQSLGVVEALADALGIDPVVPTLDGGLAPVAPNSGTYRFVQRYWNTGRGTGGRLPVGDWTAIPAAPRREPRGRTWTDGTGRRFTDNDVRQRPYAGAGGTRLLGVDVLPGTDDGLRREGRALAFRDPWVLHTVRTADGDQILGAEKRRLPSALH